jgi:hypothetical protein
MKSAKGGFTSGGAHLRLGKFSCCVRKEFIHPSLLKWLEQELATSRSEYGPASRHAQSRRRVVNHNGAQRAFYIKRYFSPRLSYTLKDIFRHSKAMKAWKAAQMLSRDGFHTAPALAAGERRKFGILTDAFLITDEVCASSVAEVAGQLSLDPSPETMRRKRELIRSFGAEVGRMHALRILHGDLVPGNILVDASFEPAKFVFLDNDRTRKLLANLPLKLVERNLVQVGRFRLPGISSTDRLRFFKAYIGQNPRFKGKEKQLLARVIGKTRRRVLKLEHSGECAAETMSFRLLMACKQ